jgi:hypothetical protein
MAEYYRDVVRLLLDAGADPDTLALKRRMPLHAVNAGIVEGTATPVRHRTQ